MSDKVIYQLRNMKKKLLKRRMLYAEEHRENIVERFYMALENRNKSHGYRKQNYVDNFYYTTTSGELGVIKSKGHNSGKSLGEMLVRRNVIDKWTHDAKVELNGTKESYGVKGVIIKHNRVLEDLKKTLSEEDAQYLTTYFDKAENCTMTIDKDFKSAYDPMYRESAVYKGDLCSSSSCMSCRGEGAQQFYGNIPCCNVVRFERDGQQVGRCIMYNFNGKRHFIRIYGKPEYLPKMYKLLKRELRPEDMFGRQLMIDELNEETTIPDDAQNMYLDGCNYGFVYWVDDEDKTHYVMCTRNEASKIIEKNPNARWNSMKSTSTETVEKVLNPRYVEPEYEYTCDHCGAGIPEDDEDCVWIDDNVYCCSDCAYEAGYEVCERCGEWGWRDDGISTEDCWFCCDTCANNAGYHKCEKCGKYEYEDYMYDVRGEGYICEECKDELNNDEKIVKCDYCGDWTSKDYAYKVIKKETREEVWLDEYCHDTHMEQYDEIKEGDDVEEE